VRGLPRRLPAALARTVRLGMLPNVLAVAARGALPRHEVNEGRHAAVPLAFVNNCVVDLEFENLPIPKQTRQPFPRVHVLALGRPPVP